ncbi:MAG: DUF4388 domain-containing protein [Verrucomicrobiae bacterium]|nr:DUF4388 domain-containing protein [Verrucomicrobiae bacterium]
MENSHRAKDAVYTAEYIDSKTNIAQVHEIFKKMKGNFIAVIHEHHIAGIAHRDKIVALFATQYGYSLYANRPIGEIMDRNPLIVDGNLDMVGVMKQVIQRPEATFYDDVIVASDGVFDGLASIKALLIEQYKQLREKLRELEEQHMVLAQTMTSSLVDRNVDADSLNRKVNAILEAAREIVRTEKKAAKAAVHDQSYEAEMKGRLEMFSAIDLLQLLIQGAKSGRLNLSAGDHQGSQDFDIFLKSGNIVHSEGAGDKGLECLWKALTLQKGEFVFHFGEEATEKSIEGNSMAILLEACRRGDESENGPAAEAEIPADLFGGNTKTEPMRVPLPKAVS